MIFLLNREYVVWEVVELARLHLCEIFKIPTAKVEAKIDFADEMLRPTFNIDAEDLFREGLTAEQIKGVIENVYRDCKEEMDVRLHGITKTRDDVLREIDESRKAALRL